MRSNGSPSRWSGEDEVTTPTVHPLTHEVCHRREAHHHQPHRSLDHRRNPFYSPSPLTASPLPTLTASLSLIISPTYPPAFAHAIQAEKETERAMSMWHFSRFLLHAATTTAVSASASASSRRCRC